MPLRGGVDSQNLVRTRRNRQGIVFWQSVGTISGRDMWLTGISCKSRHNALIYLLDLAPRNANATLKKSNLRFSCAWRSGRSGILTVMEICLTPPVSSRCAGVVGRVGLYVLDRRNAQFSEVRYLVISLASIRATLIRYVLPARL